MIKYIQTTSYTAINFLIVYFVHVYSILVRYCTLIVYKYECCKKGSKIFTVMLDIQRIDAKKNCGNAKLSLMERASALN